VRDNPAIGLSLTGYYAGVMIIFLGASTGTEGDLLNLDRLLPELGVVAAYALGGIVLLNLGRKLVDKLVLRHFSIYKELVQDRNVGTGAVLFGTYIATALILAGAIYGEIPPESAFAGAWTGPVTALCYFVAGQVTLILFSFFYQWITRYDIHAEIEKDNPAAGVAFGGNMVALGILLLKASAHHFESFSDSLTEYASLAIIGFVALFLLRRLVDHVLLPGTRIAHEIAVDRNLGAALIEAVVAIGMASILFFML
ncbi:MAG: DUF350 domain-containing protein, partial [Acidobacteriota bacterium]|nr:DUF350 domain-containing protein [Acidobacteriota bacterium]